MRIDDQMVGYSEQDVLEFLGQQESQSIHWGDVFEDELVNHIQQGPDLSGATLPWEPTHSLLRFRPEEVTLWAGINGHHKSMIVGQVLMWTALKNNQRCGIMSFEMPVVATMKRMVQQAAGSLSPGEGFTRQWARWNHESIAYYDKLDSTTSHRVLGVVMYMAKDMGCQSIVIDSLTKCGLPYGERGAEKDFIDALCSMAKVFKIHIHLVCHVRKPERGGEEHKPTKFDVRGAGELTDLVHNVIICWHDKKKVRLEKLRDPTPVDLKYIEKNPDQRLIIVKQRGGAYEGTIALHKLDCLQFTHRDAILPFDIPLQDLNDTRWTETPH